MKKLIPALIVISIGITIGYFMIDKPKILRVYNPIDLNPELVDESLRNVDKFHRVGNFNLTNQLGSPVTEIDYKDKIYVADCFFTTCPSICPIMTDHMYRIQKEFMNDEEVMLLSHSVTPKIDSVAQLKRYALKKGVNDGKWNLVTGDKKEIYKLARKSYFAVLEDGNGDEYDMIHTENFILIDKKRQIRGHYDGTNPDDIDKLLEDIKVLKASYKN